MNINESKTLLQTHAHTSVKLIRIILINLLLSHGHFLPLRALLGTSDVGALRRSGGADIGGPGATEGCRNGGVIIYTYIYIYTYASSHKHGSGEWAPPRLVSLQYGHFPLNHDYGRNGMFPTRMNSEQFSPLHISLGILTRPNGASTP